MKKFLCLLLCFVCCLFSACTNTPQQFTVTFLSNGEIVETVLAFKGSLISEPVAPDGEEGKEFRFWGIGDAPWDFSSRKVLENETLTASWSVVSISTPEEGTGGGSLCVPVVYSFKKFREIVQLSLKNKNLASADYPTGFLCVNADATEGLFNNVSYVAFGAQRHILPTETAIVFFEDNTVMSWEGMFEKINAEGKSEYLVTVVASGDITNITDETIIGKDGYAVTKEAEEENGFKCQYRLSHAELHGNKAQNKTAYYITVNIEIFDKTSGNADDLFAKLVGENYKNVYLLPQEESDDIPNNAGDVNAFDDGLNTLNEYTDGCIISAENIMSLNVLGNVGCSIFDFDKALQFCKATSGCLDKKPPLLIKADYDDGYFNHIKYSVHFSSDAVVRPYKLLDDVEEWALMGTADAYVFTNFAKYKDGERQFGVSVRIESSDLVFCDTPFNVENVQISEFQPSTKGDNSRGNYRLYYELNGESVLLATIAISINDDECGETAESILAHTLGENCCNIVFYGE